MKIIDAQIHIWAQTVTPPSGLHRKVSKFTAEEALKENCRHRPVQYLNNVLEQDHRAIKRRVCASQHFRSFRGA